MSRFDVCLVKWLILTIASYGILYVCTPVHYTIHGDRSGITHTIICLLINRLPNSGIVV